MKSTKDIINAVRDKLDDEVHCIGRDQYKDVLEDLAAEIEARLDCVREEEGAEE